MEYNVEYVDYETGEIVVIDYNDIETIPVDFSVMFGNGWKPASSPNNCNSAEKLKEHCNSIGEKQTHEPMVMLSMYEDVLKKEYNVVGNIIKHIKYRNIAFMTIEQLCSAFKLTDNKNLDRKLKQLEKRNVIQYSKVGRSEYKLFVNPKIFYRGAKRIYNDVCAKSEWEFGGAVVEQPNLYVHVDFNVSPATLEKEVQWALDDEYIETQMKLFGYSKSSDFTETKIKTRVNKVLGCNFQDFITNYIL